jgi:probable rRNA maturation factor
MPVAVSNLQRRARVSPVRLRRVARRALAALGRADREVHVAVVDDRRIRTLNARYLGIPRATDVLAFDLAGPGSTRLWGEVIVSAETAARQARRLGVPLAAELDLLVVHGLLHLAGYDDHHPRRARRMHRRAREILAGRSPGSIPARLWAGLLEG